MIYKAQKGQAFATFPLTSSVHTTKLTGLLSYFQDSRICSHLQLSCSLSLHRIFFPLDSPKAGSFLPSFNMILSRCPVPMGTFHIFEVVQNTSTRCSYIFTSQSLFSVSKRWRPLLSLSKHPVPYLLYLTTICNHNGLFVCFVILAFPHPTIVCESRKFIFDHRYINIFSIWHKSLAYDRI